MMIQFIPLIGRTFLATIFIHAAINKIFDFANTQTMMTEKGLPFAGVLLGGTIVFQILGGLSLVLGYKTRLGAWLLILFLIPTTVIFHNFWNVPSEKIDFLKNLSIIGGLLMITYFGAGPVSVDEHITMSNTDFTE
ncbi:MAG TPA: DoxX family protein [Planktothrix sp. UBA8407]|jgi:Predicted membrane protein|nr:DoxX family protein [Planktothrix sp. UBA8402]HAO10755.1 DoxX family protein [Planktothrix sp. UBA8407]HBK21623.1 DoxX family protein [Planktothrix sp. UBA10369]